MPIEQSSLTKLLARKLRMAAASLHGLYGETHDLEPTHIETAPVTAGSRMK
jgi:hypothetical protein